MDYIKLNPIISIHGNYVMTSYSHTAYATTTAILLLLLLPLLLLSVCRSTELEIRFLSIKFNFSLVDAVWRLEILDPSS